MNRLYQSKLRIRAEQFLPDADPPVIPDGVSIHMDRPVTNPRYDLDTGGGTVNLAPGFWVCQHIEDGRPTSRFTLSDAAFQKKYELTPNNEGIVKACILLENSETAQYLNRLANPDRAVRPTIMFKSYRDGKMGWRVDSLLVQRPSPRALRELRFTARNWNRGKVDPYWPPDGDDDTLITIDQFVHIVIHHGWGQALGPDQKFRWL